MGWLQEVPDAAGEVAFEAADGFAGGLVFGSFAVEGGLGFGVAAGGGDGDAVDGGVDLAVAAAVEPVAVGLAGAVRDRRDAGGAGELGLGAEAGDAGDLTDQLRGGQRSEAGLGECCANGRPASQRSKRSGKSVSSLTSVMRAANYLSPRRKPDRGASRTRFVATRPGFGGD